MSVTFGKGFFDDSPMCEGCCLRPAAHVHHKVHKQMGGRHGAAKKWIERAANKMRICLVCHEASHGIPARLGGFSCRVCPELPDCYYGNMALKRPYLHLTPRWLPDDR